MPNDLKTCVQNFLMAGYLYNATDIPSFLSDAEWDDLCKFIDDHYDEITHYHKHLVKRETLGTATAMYLTDDYLPSIVKHAAMARARRAEAVPRACAMENPDYIVNIPLTEEEILYLREQSKAMQEYFQSNKHLLLSNKWAYNSVTSIEGESDVSKS